MEGRNGLDSRFRAFGSILYFLLDLSKFISHKFVKKVFKVPL